MKWFWIAFGLFGVFVAAALIVFGYVNAGLEQQYSASIRTPTFSALLTLGSFLLTLKSAILQRLKDSFDTVEEARLYIRHLKKQPNRHYYSSLENMSVALSASIFMAFVSALLQLTLGFVSHPFAIGISLSSAITTFALVMYLWREIARTHRKWLSKIEAERQVELHKMPEWNN
jgi:ABC-type multidrug transport system fused ATPase/permease subunit